MNFVEQSYQNLQSFWSQDILIEIYLLIDIAEQEKQEMETTFINNLSL